MSDVAQPAPGSLRLAEQLEAYAKRYSGDWSAASPTISWDHLDVIIAALRAQPPAAPVETADEARNAHSTLWGQIAAVYGSLDAEDCAWVDREWAKWRGLAHEDADEYEKRIREKVWASGCLSAGEWVYLVDVFQSVRDAEDLTPHSPCSAESGKLRWQTASERDCYDALYQIGGALRRFGRSHFAQEAERIADALYPGKIKPAPIVPRTTT